MTAGDALAFAEEAEAAASGMIVAVRLRPITENERRQGHRKCCRVVGGQSVVIEKFGHANNHLKSQQASEKEYAFDIAFSEDATQEQVYSKTVKDIVPTILNGYHATIFAYGATGAGKTHTMMGSERDGLGEMEMEDDDVEVDGIIPHALADIFMIIRHRKEEEAVINLDHGSVFEWKVLVSYLEVYNEQIRDLLQPSDRPLALREDPARGIVHVAGLHQEEAQSVGQVLQLLRRGNRNRKTEPTAANQVSSRSHAVIQVTIKHTTTTMLSESNPRKSTTEGKLSLIDLAGSERASTTQNRGLRLTEGANINKSLLALANCINSLSSQNRRRSASLDSSSGRRPVKDALKSKVQYRDSKLTHLLKNSLEGECRLVMIANVNPSHTCFDESHNTLKYANRAKNIKIRPKMHVVTADMTYRQRIEKLELENMQLRKALAAAQAAPIFQSPGKRKSIEDMSPDTLKRFRNIPLEDLSSPNMASPAYSHAAHPPRNDLADALQAEVQQLRKEKAILEARVTDVQTENQKLCAEIALAQRNLQAAKQPALISRQPTSFIPAPIASGVLAQHTPSSRSPGRRQKSSPGPTNRPPPPTFASNSGRFSSTPPKQPPPEPKPSPRPTSRIPRRIQATSRDQENRYTSSNIQPPRGHAHVSKGSSRRVSFADTNPVPHVADAPSTFLKRPKQYRKSLGGPALPPPPPPPLPRIYG